MADQLFLDFIFFKIFLVDMYHVFKWLFGLVSRAARSLGSGSGEPAYDADDDGRC